MKTFFDWIQGNNDEEQEKELEELIKKLVEEEVKKESDRDEAIKWIWSLFNSDDDKDDQPPTGKNKK